MEPHGSVAKWDGNRLTIWDTTQGVYSVQEGMARAMGLPLANVRVIGHYMGGGFGSKLEVGKYTVYAALMAKTTGRPVKIFLPREDCFLATGNRPGNKMTVKIGAKKDGTLTAIDYKSLGSPGAYSAGAGSSSLAAYLYTCAERPDRGHRRSTPTRARRGRCARRAFRRARGPSNRPWMSSRKSSMSTRSNCVCKTSPTELQVEDGMPYTSNQLAECLRKGAAEFGWSEARSRTKTDSHLRRGVGVAACFWGYGGGPPSTVIVKLFSDGSVNLNMGASDIGTGTKTWAAMIVAEELGVAVDQIQIEHADTATTQYATSSGGSKTVPSDSPAVRAAAYAVKVQLMRMAAEQLEVDVSDLELRDLTISSRSDSEKSVEVTGTREARPARARDRHRLS